MSPDKYRAQDAILIVDDDEMQRELMKAALADFGLPIHEAANGAEALEVFQEHSPMLIVMDINMPVMDGYAACEEMRHYPGGQDAAIILVTGMEDLASIQMAFDVGAIEFITKPFDWPMFQMRIKYIIRIQQTYLEVQESREKLAWAQRAVGVGSWDFDPETRSLCLAAESLGLFDMDQNATCFSLDTVYQAVRRQDRRLVLKAYAQLMRENIPMDLDLRLNLGDGKNVTVHIYGEQVLRDKGQRIGISGTVQDITERKRAEEKIREAAAMKGQFLANMSHELRTPINGVMGMTDLLQKTDLDAEQARWTAYIGESARHLQTVLNDVLDFAKIEAGRVRVQPDPFDLRRAVASTGELVEAMAQKKGLTLSIAVDDDLPQIMVGDAGRIRQVLLNMVGNAVKFTEQGSVDIRASLVHQETSRCHVRFSIRDTGIGIPLEKQTMIFEQFTQVDGSLTRQHEGAGLGLAISRELVVLMDGEIGIQSQEGLGTEIWFVLPLGWRDSAAPILPAIAPETGSVPVDPGAVRVLLVEDNPINQVFGKKILEQIGFTVDTANDGAQALAMVQQQTYGVVLMDCQMPVMDGYEATRRIRRLGPKFQRLPIIALTAHALEGDRAKCLAAGMNDYITKPVEGDGLVQYISKWARAIEPVEA